MADQNAIDIKPESAKPNQRSRQILLAAVILGGAGLWWWHTRPAPAQFVTARITRGNVSRAIVTTGTVNPVTTVQVGSYVSGTIQSLYCDFNTKVKAGELCARIDPRPYQVVYDQAAANLAGAKAQLKKDQANLTYAELNYKRDTGLQKQGIVSQDSLDLDRNARDQARAQIAVDEAAVKQRQALLDAARVNLDYTNIVSPVDGTVVSRSIDVGQTVASSFQTPTLFLIAKDLTQMQVDTNVSESDVGSTKVGQKALFTVEAYPGKTFVGKVRQVRQAPITVQNVVTYNVVISVRNPDLKLLPGMTANTRIITSEHDNVLRVPIQALRFTLEQPGGNDANRRAAATRQHIYLLQDGEPRRVAVTVGLSDNIHAEVIAKDIKAGDEVIVNQIKAGEAKNNAPRHSPLRF